MTLLQKVFLLFALMYLLIKGVIFFALYLITLRIEKRALALKEKGKKYSEKDGSKTVNYIVSNTKTMRNERS